jgi:hypothetical protein
MLPTTSTHHSIGIPNWFQFQSTYEQPKYKEGCLENSGTYPHGDPPKWMEIVLPKNHAKLTSLDSWCLSLSMTVISGIWVFPQFTHPLVFPKHNNMKFEISYQLKHGKISVASVPSF